MPKATFTVEVELENAQHCEGCVFLDYNNSYRTSCFIALEVIRNKRRKILKQEFDVEPETGQIIRPQACIDKFDKKSEQGEQVFGVGNQI